MAEAYLAEIRIFGFSFPPLNWAFCQGQIMPISQNTALFSLLGTNYGGNGTTNYALPNLSGSVALGFGQMTGGSDYGLGEIGGETTVTLTTAEMPAHSHSFNSLGFRTDAEGNVPGPTQSYANAKGCTPYIPATGSPTPPAPNLVAMDPMSLMPAGGGPSGTNPHNNMMPYIAMNYCICTRGIFPPRT